MISPATPHILLYPPPQMEHYCTYIFPVLHGRVEVAKSKMAAVIWRNRRRAFLGETSKAQEQTILRLIFLKRSRQMRKLPEGNGKKRNVLSSYAANSSVWKQVPTQLSAIWIHSLPVISSDERFGGLPRSVRRAKHKSKRMIT